MIHHRRMCKQTVKEVVFQGTRVLQRDQQLHHEVGQVLLVSPVMAGQAG
ncbi:hypothetical protein SOVF_138680 [Spinacia oleracea]|nr:hypothetical protein SOVF_138680 [Spinacia oleracea]